MDSKQDLTEPLIASSKILHTPLVGTELTTTSEEEEENTMVGCAIGISYGKEQDDEDEDDDSSFTCCDNIIVWIVLPVLLFVQFAMAFKTGGEALRQVLSWSVVNYSIVLFVITSWLYRSACRDCKLRNSILLLLPEIVVDVILGLVLFDKTVLGFMVMLSSMLGLALFVMLTSIHILCFKDKSSLSEDKLILKIGLLREPLPTDAAHTV